MIKILFLTSEGFDTPNSINHLCETLLEDILKAGIEVHSISSHKTGQYEDIPQHLLGYPNFKYDIIHRNVIDKNNFIRRYFDEVVYAFRARKVWRIHKSEYDVVLLQSNPNSIVNSILLKASIKCPILLNLYDVFPGHAMSIGVIKSRLVYNVLRWIQKILYRKCSYIVAMSEDMKKQLLLEDVRDEKIVVIHNWFDNLAFDTIERESNLFFKKYGLNPNHFYVQFAGLLGYVFDYQMYFDVAEQLKDDPGIHFLLIGDGNQKARIIEEIEMRGLCNIQYFSWQPLNMIGHVYSACDIGLIPLKPGVIGNGMPSKACQLMAARRVIVNSVEESEYTRLFDRYDMGVNVVDHSPKKVADIIKSLRDHPDRFKEIGENAHRYSYEHYSREINTTKFVALIQKAATR